MGSKIMASMESILGRNKQEKRFLQMFGEDVLEGGPKRKHNSGVVFKDKQFDQRGAMQKKNVAAGPHHFIFENAPII